MSEDEERLLRHCQEVFRQKHAIEFSESMVGAKLGSLQMKRMNMSSVIDEAVTEYSKASCLSLCTGPGFWKLPLEVRQMIYRNFLPVDPCKTEFTSKWQIDKTSWSSYVCKGHLADRKWVGTRFLKELWETHMEESFFEFGGDFEKLARFRTLDPYDLGKTPADYRIHLGVTISSTIYRGDFAWLRDPRKNNEYSPHWSNDFRARSNILELSPLMTHLEFLFGFSPCTHIHIKLDIDREEIPGSLESKDHWECDVLLPCMFPTLRRLAAAGTYVHLHIVHHDMKLVLSYGNITLEQIQQRYYQHPKVMQWFKIFEAQEAKAAS